MRIQTFAILALLLVSSCQDEPISEVVLPSNLSAEVEVSNSVPGLVEVTAKATSANFFTIIFEDNGEFIEQESKDGTAEYTYSTSGTYSIEVRANAIYDDYISSNQNVTVVVENELIIPDFPTTGYSTPISYPDYTLVWSDEFDGSSLSASNWNYEIGTGSGGWGNNERQYYLEENTKVEGGYLTIQAKKEEFNGSPYTSSRITTQGKQSFKYGRIDIRAALPYGQGMWPALWMLGESIDPLGWPKCGEIDIMELVGGNVTGGGDDVIHGTLHWDENGTKADFGRANKLSEGIFAQEFHVFSIIWDENEIRWLRDDTQFLVIDISGASMSEFREEFFFIFNIAVGGNWPGNPNASTVFPQRMIVDYVRVFQ